MCYPQVGLQRFFRKLKAPSEGISKFSGEEEKIWACRMLDKDPTYSDCVEFEQFSDFDFMTWTHFCVTFDVEHGDDNVTTTTFRLFVNGEMVKEGEVSTISIHVYLFIKGNKTVETRDFWPFRMDEVKLGQETDHYWGLRLKDQSFSGEITMFNFWDSLISEEDIQKLHQCQTLTDVRKQMRLFFTNLFN